MPSRNRIRQRRIDELLANLDSGAPAGAGPIAPHLADRQSPAGKADKLQRLLPLLREKTPKIVQQNLKYYIHLLVE
jgi:hypothetical protein